MLQPKIHCVCNKMLNFVSVNLAALTAQKAHRSALAMYNCLSVTHKYTRAGLEGLSMSQP